MENTAFFVDPTSALRINGSDITISGVSCGGITSYVEKMMGIHLWIFEMYVMVMKNPHKSSLIILILEVLTVNQCKKMMWMQTIVRSLDGI